jgi:hypothetical protein
VICLASILFILFAKPAILRTAVSTGMSPPTPLDARILHLVVKEAVHEQIHQVQHTSSKTAGIPPVLDLLLCRYFCLTTLSLLAGWRRMHTSRASNTYSPWFLWF